MRMRALVLAATTAALALSAAAPTVGTSTTGGPMALPSTAAASAAIATIGAVSAAVPTFAAASAVIATTTVVPAVVPTTATMYFVQGMPDAVLDLCVNHREVKSNLRYGQQFKLALPFGRYEVSIYRSDPQTCSGHLLRSQPFTLRAGPSLTVLARLVFVRLPTGRLIRIHALEGWATDLSGTAGKAALVVRDTTTRRLGDLFDVWISGGVRPVVAEIGSTGMIPLTQSVYSWWLSAPRTYRPVIGPAIMWLRSGMVYQVYAVGTNSRDLRFVVVAAPGT